MVKLQLVLTEDQLTTMLRALGELNREQYNKGESTAITEQVVNKIYKAMGVKL